jgi:methyl-accepting chemotaxis protein
MKVLAASTGQIGTITTAIAEISTQTNVLSLNATIVAASAGVHGRGFSVIAEEIRRLSAETHRSSRQIADIVGKLKEQTEKARNDLMQTRAGFLEQNIRVAETQSAFASIGESMGEISAHILAVYGRIMEADHGTLQLSDAVQEVAAAAQETAAGSEEVRDGAARQNHSILRIAGGADHLHELSTKLYGEIRKFRVEESDPAEDGETGGIPPEGTGSRVETDRISMGTA